MSQETHPIYSDPEFFERLLRATDAVQNSRLAEARQIAEEAIETRPGSAEGFFLIGVLAFLDEDFARAIPLFELAHKIDPDTADYANALACTHARIGNLGDSAYFAKLATVLTPHPVLDTADLEGLQNYRDALLNVSDVSYISDAIRALDAGMGDEALRCMENQRAIGKGDAFTAYLTGRALQSLGALEGAQNAFDAAIHMESDNVLYHAAQADLLAERGDILTARAQAEHALSLAKVAGDPDALETALAVAASIADRDQPWPGYLAALAAWKSRVPVAEAATERLPGPLRIGILTDAAGATQIGPFLVGLMRTRIEETSVYLYATTGRNDSKTQQMRTLGAQWVDLVDIDSDTASAILGGDDLDVLIDVTTTWEGRRPSLLRQSGARLRLGWPGRARDLTADALTHVIETRLPGITAAQPDTGPASLTPDGAILALLPPTEMPATDQAPGHTNGSVTFGAIADPAFLTPRMAGLIARILRHMPEAQVVLGNTARPRDADRLLAPFRHLGVLGRVHLALPEEEDGEAPQGADFFRHLDVLLDPVTISRPLDAAQALWDGVPVVALAEGSALGAHVLAAAGQDPWIATTDDDYVTKAVAAAQWATGTEASRTALHTAVKDTALFQPGAMARALVATLRTVTGD